MTASIDIELLNAIADERYKDKRHLSARQFEEEPWEAVWMARTVWAADIKRANLEEERQRNKSR